MFKTEPPQALPRTAPAHILRFMDQAEITELNRRWVEQWRITGPMLEAIKREDLQAMTEAEACAISESLLSAIPFPRPPGPRDHYSGLIEQQRIFARAR